MLTTVVALILSVLFFGLKPMSDANEVYFKRQEVLEAIVPPSEFKALKKDKEKLNGMFEGAVEELVLDYEGKIIEGVKATDVELKNEEKKDVEDRKYPLYVFNEGGSKSYIVPVRGNGLWDKIWGFIAIDSDLSTIKGVSFGHKAETPGLGAEIKDNAGWKGLFTGKQILNQEGEFVSVEVTKRPIKKAEEPYKVQAISGATVTCVGVSDMIDEYFRFYLPYFNSLSKQNG